MKVLLNKEELKLIAAALNAYADKAMEGSRKERKRAEIDGRKLCSRFLIAMTKEDGTETETAFENARANFCGMADDEDLDG